MALQSASASRHLEECLGDLDWILVNRSDESLCAFHGWAGPALRHARVVPDLEQIGTIRGAIILVHPVEANAKLDLVRELSGHNLFVFVNIGEVDTGNMQALLMDEPKFAKNPWILGGQHRDLWHTNLNSFYFLTLSDVNCLNALEYATPKIYSTTNKPYDFLYLNGHDRRHRNQLWHAIGSRGLLKRGLCSYLGYHTDPSHRCDIPLTVLPDLYESPYRDTKSVNHDISDERSRFHFMQHFWQHQPVPMQILPERYRDTYFTLDAEMSVQHYFPTEKTYKAILTGHPFIILSAPGYLQHLRQMGFQTFDPMIDESYDQEPDLGRRIQMISNEVQRLCSLDLDQWLARCKEICMFNQQHYIHNRLTLFRKMNKDLSTFLDQVRSYALSTLETND